MIEIDFGELIKLGIWQLLLGAEEASIDRVPVKLIESIENAHPVIHPDGAHRNLCAVLQGLADEIVAMISHRPGSVDDVRAAVDIEPVARDKSGPVH